MFVSGYRILNTISMGYINMLDHVSEKMLLCLEEAGLDGGYLQEKRERFERFDNKYEALQWATNLDKTNQQRLAKKLDCTNEQLMFVVKFLNHSV